MIEVPTDMKLLKMFYFLSLLKALTETTFFLKVLRMEWMDLLNRKFFFAEFHHVTYINNIDVNYVNSSKSQLSYNHTIFLVWYPYIFLSFFKKNLKCLGFFYFYQYFSNNPVKTVKLKIKSHYSQVNLRV